MMEQKIFKEKYPVYELVVSKDQCQYASVEAILDYLQKQVDAHPKAVNIARFDHYQHTQNINGEINPEIVAAQNLVLCFGMKLPSADPMAVRPRSIGVTDLGDRFVVNFMEAPNPVATEAMEAWVKDIVK